MEKRLENALKELISNQVAIRHDVDVIKRELLGSSEYGNSGYKHRIEKIEDKIDKVEKITYKRIWLERGIFATLSTIWIITLKVWDKIFGT